ncbi:hypothetical protein CPY51_05815 [Rhizobium tubonense]|uniref:Uncharacterized protein n=1 Tax=Rhizobium tubonense TaxID=484088 RepID=A0A2W4CY40_9HYPH|nr:hypothetical protein CPY51_05815 [Rhizobium tubonense]
MAKFTVITHHDIDADDAQHVALLVYKELSRWPPPLYYAKRAHRQTWCRTVTPPANLPKSMMSRTLVAGPAKGSNGVVRESLTILGQHGDRLAKRGQA